jgi:hypothetical protein
VLEDQVLENQHWNVPPVLQPQMRVGVDVDLLELDAERAQLDRNIVV